MILHPAKTKSMLLTTRQKHQFLPLHLNLSLEDSHTEQVHEHRHLGVIIDELKQWIIPLFSGTCEFFTLISHEPSVASRRPKPAINYV